MTQPTFDSFVSLLTGWVISGARTIAGMIVPVGAVRDGWSARGVKHHAAYHRVFAAA